jgi:hypothetical protein
VPIQTEKLNSGELQYLMQSIGATENSESFPFRLNGEGWFTGALYQRKDWDRILSKFHGEV